MAWIYKLVLRRFDRRSFRDLRLFSLWVSYPFWKKNVSFRRPRIRPLSKNFTANHLGKHPQFGKPKPAKGKAEAHFEIHHYAGTRVRTQQRAGSKRTKIPSTTTVYVIAKRFLTGPEYQGSLLLVLNSLPNRRTPC